MEMSGKEKMRAYKKVHDISFELFEKTGKIAYYGACVGARELATELKKQKQSGEQAES